MALGCLFAAGVLGVLLLGWPSQRGTFLPSDGAAAPGEIVVQFSADVSPEQQASVLAAHGATLTRDMLVPGFAVANVPAGSEESIGASLAESGVIASTTENPLRTPADVPDDPYYPQQWNMPMIGMNTARDEADGSGVTVAVIDTGVAFENYFDSSLHKDFAQAADLSGTLFVDPCDMWSSPPPDAFTCLDPHPNDDYGHGTHVTGTIAQNTNNAYGAAGIAPKVHIMPIKVCGPNGPGGPEVCSDDRTADGVEYAIENGADVINLSIAGPVNANQALRDALAHAEASRVVVIAASGNAGSGTLQYPAAINGVVAVGAVGQFKEWASYSNYGNGETLPGKDPHTLDLVAPGGDANEGPGSVILQQTYSTCTNATNYTLLPPVTACRGTSMAAAHVTGVAALIMSKFQDLTSLQVKSVLTRCAEDLGDHTHLGAGLVRADNSLLDLDKDNIPDCIDSSVITATPSATPFPTPLPPNNECVPPTFSPSPSPSPTIPSTPTPINTGPSPTPRETSTPGVQGSPVTDTPTPTPTDTAPLSDTPTAAPTDTPTATPTTTPTQTPAGPPTDSPTPRDTQLATETPTPTPRTKCGDVNCSGAVNAMDALGVLLWLTESSQTPCIGFGYVNCDGALDTVDAAVILRYSADLTLNLPAGCSGIDGS
jgi:serine protease